MNSLIKLSFAAVIGASALAMAATSASARIVCNEEGDCWHVQTEYEYAPTFGLTIRRSFC
jgi:hypothetical protein